MEHKSKIIWPDLFGFYKHEITGLLTQNEDYGSKDALNTPHFTSHTTSLFTNSLEDVVSVFNRDLLKASLRQSARALSEEVNEMIDPVMRMRHILDCLSSKTSKSFDGEALATRDLDSTLPPSKKQKMWSSSGKENLLGERSRDAEPRPQDDDVLKLLMGSKMSVVEEIMKKQSNEHYETLNHMELQLEELLGAVASKCRQMTHQEKFQLRKFIQELPTRNLDRVVEIIHQGKSSDTLSMDEIVVDLENQDNATLWRLYFYTRAVENARMLLA